MFPSTVDSFSQLYFLILFIEAHVFLRYLCKTRFFHNLRSSKVQTSRSTDQNVYMYLCLKKKRERWNTFTLFIIFKKRINPISTSLQKSWKGRRYTQNFNTMMMHSMQAKQFNFYITLFWTRNYFLNFSSPWFICRSILTIFYILKQHFEKNTSDIANLDTY